MSSVRPAAEHLMADVDARGLTDGAGREVIDGDLGDGARHVERHRRKGGERPAVCCSAGRRQTQGRSGTRWSVPIRPRSSPAGCTPRTWISAADDQGPRLPASVIAVRRTVSRGDRPGSGPAFGGRVDELPLATGEKFAPSVLTVTVYRPMLPLKLPSWRGRYRRPDTGPRRRHVEGHAVRQRRRRALVPGVPEGRRVAVQHARRDNRLLHRSPSPSEPVRAQHRRRNVAQHRDLCRGRPGTAVAGFGAGGQPDEAGRHGGEQGGLFYGVVRPRAGGDGAVKVEPSRLTVTEY